MATKKIEVTIIESFEDYLNNINVFDVFSTIGSKTSLFRGQLESEWDLLPGLARPKFFRDNIEEHEKKLLLEFKRRAIPFLPNSFNANSDWEWLALAQHYKLPTRLLDWTENPLVALYFAFEYPKDNNNDRVVWSFSASANEFAESNNLKIKPFSLSKTQVYMPNQVTQRITAQSGWFTVHKYMKDTNKFIALNKNTIYKDRIFKMVIPNKLRDEILFRLDRLGVNSFSIYPDLEGLSTYLSWKHLKK
jgi:hypothetical protein